MTNVKIDVEYCGSCGHQKQFLEMMNIIKQSVPSAQVYGTAGRQASFEIKVNDELVYSKLQTLAFPEFEEVCNLVKDVTEGEPIRKIEKQQPINCLIS